MPADDRGPSLDAVTTVRRCRHGELRFLPSDAYVGRSLDLYGEFSELEGRLLERLVRPGDVIIEAGANIGAHTVHLSRLVGEEGRVIAYEPQPLVHRILLDNLQRNGRRNADARCAGLAAAPGMPAPAPQDHAAPGNFDDISPGRGVGQGVPVETIDALGLARLDLLKVDVEGMEGAVLEGAAETIRRCRPILYVENDRPQSSARLISLIASLGYRLWWHAPPLFNPDNHAGRKENVFGATVSINMLCLPEGRTPPEALPPVAGAQDDWRLMGLRRGASVPCKVCGGSALPAGAVDLNRSCEDAKAPVLPPAGTSVAYHRCPACGFLFTRFFDAWPKARLRRELYGQDYGRVDPDAATRRPQSVAETVVRLFGAHAGRLSVLECGGGNARTAGWLKAKGFANVVLADPFFAGAALAGRYDLVLAFEAVEHLADPDEAFKAVAPVIGDSGVFLFSTLLSTLADAPGAAWWYAAPRNGHVSLHTHDSLSRVVRRHGLTLASDGRLVHMAFRRCPDWAARAVGAG